MVDLSESVTDAKEMRLAPSDDGVDASS